MENTDPAKAAESVDEISSQLDAYLDSILVMVKSFVTPWSLIQFGLIVAAFCLAWLFSYIIENPIETRLRNIRGRPRLLRSLVVVFRRSRWIIFATILWIIFAILRQGTWPSRSYFILIAAGLVTAWVVISISSRVIRNRTVAKTVAVATWGLLALYFTSLLGPVSSWLDYAAFEVGSMRLSLLLLVKAFMLLALLLWLASVFGEFIESWLSRNQDLTPRLQVLISKTVKVTLFVLAVLVGLSAVGVDLTALTVFSGAVGLGIGFGLQKIFSNLISGMIILMDKSIKPGDVISLGDKFGWISSLRGRYVSVVTRDGWEFLIPNEDFISQQVINWSYSSDLVRLDVDFGVSYDSDPHEIRKLAVEAVKEIDRISSNPAPVCHLKAFGGS
ncbi:MAG: mechanosensitive ion channel, partial [Fimbriimonadaceae bacterium]|nr:mechanosensitive ion channel [Alphaproteobacteria bacterium]